MNRSTPDFVSTLPNAERLLVGRILGGLDFSTDGITEVSLTKKISGRTQRIAKILRSMSEYGLIEKSGRGVKGAPYLYRIATQLIEHNISDPAGILI